MHIYVHVPFCARRCSYCDFAIAVRRSTPDRVFIDAIIREWRGRIALTPQSAAVRIHTLYFGGGTPSRLDPSSIRQLVAGLSMSHPLADDAEVTLEANPDDVSLPRARAWAASGVNRISLGVQSYEPAVLEWMHRTHRAEQVAPAVAALRQAGIDNISIDMIFALPTVLQRDWRRDLERTLALAPTHVSLYGLTVEPHTPLFRWMQRGTAFPTPDETYAAEYLGAHARLTDAGFEHYEVSSASRPGFRSRHNSAYWSGDEYLGLGPSAHSLEQGTRRWNVREWVPYQRQIEAGETPIAGSETLDADARLLERRYLGLRTRQGLAVAELPPGTAESWVRQGWAETSRGIVRLTAEGWLRLDALVAAAYHS